jgi:hypothetical protein
MARERPKAGDVFQIPVDEEHVAYGQVLEPDEPMSHFVVFDGLYKKGEDKDLDEVVREPVILYSWSSDRLLRRNGKWRIVGNLPVDPRAFPPVEFVEMAGPDEFDVIDWAGNVLRPASRADVEKAPFRTSRGPESVQEAVEAWHGRRPWADKYLSMRPWDERNADLDDETSRLLRRLRN